MWLLLPIVCTLMRAVFANPESASSFSDATRPANRSGDALANRNKIIELWTDASTKWNRKPIAMETDRTGIDPDAETSNESSKRKFKGDLDDTKADERIDSNLITVAKRRETMNSWFNVPTNEKEFQDGSQKKKDHWLRWWEDKRISSYGQSPDIRRPIRVPFNSWAGKRAGGQNTPYSRSNQIDTQTKRNQVTRGRMPVDEYTVKRIETAPHNRFETFPGKRDRYDRESEEDSGQDRNPDRSTRTMSSSNVDQNSPASVHLFDTYAADEFLKTDDTTRFKGEPDVTRGNSQMPERKKADVDDRWVGKHGSSPYQISKHEGTTKSNATWRVEFCMLIPTKTARRRERFEDWGRKRNMKTYAFHSADKYLEVPRRSAKERDIFFPWTG